MDLCFQLAIRDNKLKADLVSIADYLHFAEQEGVVSRHPNLMDSWMLLKVDGKELLGENWNLGELELIVLQCEEAHRRLTKGEDAIIRSAVLDQPMVPYLLMSPLDDDDVHLSLFVIPDLKAGWAFPIDNVSADSAELWAYMRDHRYQLLHPSERLANNLFSDVPCPRVQLVTALEREASLGRRLFSEVGHEMQWE